MRLALPTRGRPGAFHPRPRGGRPQVGNSDPREPGSYQPPLGEDLALGLTSASPGSSPTLPGSRGLPEARAGELRDTQVRGVFSSLTFRVPKRLSREPDTLPACVRTVSRSNANPRKSSPCFSQTGP